MKGFIVFYTVVAMSLLIGIAIYITQIEKKVNRIHEVINCFDTDMWKIRYIYDYSLHTNIVIDQVRDQTIETKCTTQFIYDHLFDDRKSTCKNCIHGDVCSNQWLMLPDTEMKDICKNFEMKPKENSNA